MRRGGLGRIVRRVLFFAVVALVVGAWQLAQQPLIEQATGTLVRDAADQTSVAANIALSPMTVPSTPVDGVTQPSLPETRVVMAEVLMLRTKPSTTAAFLDRLRANRQVTLLGEERQSGNILWVKVKAGERMGWVSAAYLQ